MNKIIRCFFAVCAIIISFFPIASAAEHLNKQRDPSVFVFSTLSDVDLLSSEQVNSLLNKVFISAHSGNSTLFWQSVALTFQKVKKVYADLGKYLYASLCSIFRW